MQEERRAKRAVSVGGLPAERPGGHRDGSWGQRQDGLRPANVEWPRSHRDAGGRVRRSEVCDVGRCIIFDMRVCTCEH